MGLIFVVPFVSLLKGNDTTAPTQEPAVAVARWFLRPPDGGCGMREVGAKKPGVELGLAKGGIQWGIT